ncbi:unnamed protein product [Phytomonas sp. EM1]|nr:unnamed protein product [Phytomonas sp. EM1]|eukprot:CCW60139.1 unnamed protein product [Phytomonas sp. isolate EM1]
MLHSFIFIPPDVYTTDLVDLTTEALKRAEVQVDQVLAFTGEEAQRYGNHVQRHHTIVEHYAMSSTSDILKEAICNTAEVHSMFFYHFRELWDQVVDEGRLLTAQDALTSIGCSTDDLHSYLPRKSDPATKKLFRGFYVGILREDLPQATLSKPLYVINGFFPAFLESFNNPGCRCGILAVSWPQALYNYTEYRTKVLGSNELPAPVLECLEGCTLLDEGNPRSRDPCWDDVLEVASGPLEVLAWRRAWLDEDLVESELGCELLQRGLSRTFLEKLLEDPILLLPTGHLTSIFEVFASLENLETLVERVQKLYTRLHAEEEERGRDNLADRTISHNATSIKEAAPTRTSPDEVCDGLKLFDQNGNGPIFVTRGSDQEADEVARNTALLLVKPSAFTPRALLAIWQCILAHNIAGLRMEDEDDIDAIQIQASNLVDRHYRTIAYYAGDCPLYDIPLDTETLERFQQGYGISWADAVAGGLVWSATNLLQFLTWVTPSDLYELWSAQPCKIKLTSGAYVAKLSIGPKDDATCYYVVNGFYPYLRNLFLSPGSKTKCYIISWPETALSWSSFRKDVIGCTDPSKAPSNSLRGMLYRDWKDLDLAQQPSSTENGVHASASPLEAMIEEHLWLGTPLGRCCCSALMRKRFGLSPATWLSWASNPHIRIDGGPRSTRVFDVMENKNTHEFLLAALQEERQQLSHYNAEKMNCAVLVLHPSSISGALGELVKDILMRFQITVQGEGYVYGNDAARRALGMPTLQVMLHLASIRGDELLSQITVSARRRFYEVFHHDMDACKEALIGGEQACTELGLSSLDLLHACTRAGHHQLSSHCQVSFLSEHQCFVINGAYPYLREKYSMSVGCRAHYYKVAWEECNWSWESFYGFVMGHSKGCSPDTKIAFAKSPGPTESLCDILSQELLEGERDNLMMLGPEVLWYFSPGPLQALSDVLQWSLPPGITSCKHDEDRELRLLQDPLAQWLLMKGVPPYIVTHFGFLKSGSTAIEQEMLEQMSTGHNTSLCVRLTRSVAGDLARMATQHFGFLWLPPNIANRGFAEDILGLLAGHGVRVLDHGKLFLDDAARKHPLKRPYSAFFQNACQRSAIDVIITTTEMAQFKRVFDIEWSTAVELSLVLNAKEAAERYGEDHIVRCWDRSLRKVCLSPKLYVCYMEKEGVYVMNPHYLLARSRVLFGGDHAAWYSVCWRVDRMNWDDFLNTVIGSDQDAQPAPRSLRAYLSSHWRSYGLMRPPDTNEPGLYVSSTPIEAMTERCLWFDIPPEEDVLGRWLVWNGVQPSFLKMSITNPVVRLNNAPGTTNMHLFDVLPCSSNHRGSGDLLHAFLAYQNRSTFQVVPMKSPRSVGIHEVWPSQVVLPIHSTRSHRTAHAVLTLNPSLLVHSKDYPIVLSFLKHQLREHDIQVLATGSLSPEQADRRQVFSILHKRLLRYAVRVDASKLCASLSDEEKKCLSGILSTTNTNDDGDVARSGTTNELTNVGDRARVLNAMQFADAYGLTSKNVHAVWDCCSSVVRVAPDLYVGKVPSECLHIVNGFVPYCMNVSALLPWTYLLVAFDESRISYDTLLSRIIGSPHPQETEPGSLHAILRECWCSLGLTTPPHPFMGVVHASSSALVALQHRRLFMVNPPSLKVDPLGYECVMQHGLSSCFLRLASTGTFLSTQGSLFDRFAGKSTENTLGLLRDLERDYYQSPVRNTALIVIKPHSLARCVAQTVEETLNAWHVRIDEEGDVSGETAREIGLLRCLMPGVLAYAVCNPSDLTLLPDEHTAIQQAFHVSWSDLVIHGIVLNAYTALSRLGNLTAPQLLDYWRDTHRRRVVLRGGDLELTELAEHGLYVLNAFVPALKQSVESAHVLTHWYVVSWCGDDLSWEQFSLEVIGSEGNPAEAAAESIRGKIYSQWRMFGLENAPDRVFNIVHASIDSWHGLFERLCVVQPRLEQDPLGDVIVKSTVHPGLVELWLTDPYLLEDAISNHIYSSGGDMMTLSPEVVMRDSSRLVYYMEEISAEVCEHISAQRAATVLESDDTNILELHQFSRDAVRKPQNIQEDGRTLPADDVVSTFLYLVKGYEAAKAEEGSKKKIPKSLTPAVYTACDSEERKRYTKMREHLEMALNYAHSIRNC